MKKIEEEMKDAIATGRTLSHSKHADAELAVKVAMKYIEQAWFDGYYAIASLELTEDEIKDGELPVAICWKRWCKKNLPKD